MTIAVSPSLSTEADEGTIIDACYFVARVLRNLVRGYETTEVSKEPAPEARELAERAIREIEIYEHEKLTQLSVNRLLEYVSLLEELQGQRAVAADAARADAILDEMRLSEGRFI